MAVAVHGIEAQIDQGSWNIFKASPLIEEGHTGARTAECLRHP